MSYANVNDAIQAISSIDATQADIISFVRQLSVEVSGSTTVLYAGSIENTPAWQIVESMGGDVRHIGRTMVAEVLNSDEFKAKVAQSFGLTAARFEAELGNPESAHPAKIWLNKGGSGGPWATASEMFVEATTGPVRILSRPCESRNPLFLNGFRVISDGHISQS